MIRTENGKTTASGTGLDIMADLACIIESLSEHYPKSMIEDAIKVGFMTEEEENAELAKIQSKLGFATLIANLIKKEGK